MIDIPPPPVAGTDARETTRELSEAELDAIESHLRERVAIPKCQNGAGIDCWTALALVAMARRAKP